MTTPLVQPVQPPSSFELSKLPTDKEPLPEAEVNIYNLIFKDQPVHAEQNELQKNKKTEMTMTKKALISFMFACIVLLHAITPISSILKAFQSNTYIMILIAAVYTVIMYYAINTFFC